MQARRLLSTLFAVAMFSTSCAAMSSNTAAGPPPPPVDEVINTDVSFPDDGLTRLIVTPIVGAPSAPISAGEDAPAPGTVGGVSPMEIDPSRLLTPEMVASMPPGADLEARDGRVGYVDTDGNFVAFEPAAAAPAPTPPVTEELDVEEEEPVEIEPVYGNPYIDALAVDPGVEHITVVGDGTFGVTLRDPSIIDPSVFSVVEDVPLGITVDQYEGYQWALENDGTNLDRVASITQTEDADLDALPTVGRADGKGIVVAVIDSGVDFSHPDLENSQWNNLGETCGNGIDDDENGFVDDCNGWDFAFNDASPFNRGADSHGTHVAGIITANRNSVGVAGIAPEARIMDLNVAAGSGSGLSISGAAVTAAVRYAVDNGADIINMSIGSQPGTPAASVASMGAAIDYAAANGVLVVVAAGNNNVDLSSLSVYPASFNRSNMLVVGASTPSDTRADFSNYSASIVDLYAPGVLMLSTVPGPDYRFMSGTSQASPATAAVAALVMQTYPDASMGDVIDAVTSSTDRREALSTSTVSGRANAASAIGEGEAPPIPTELQVAVSGLLAPSNEVSATVEITTPPAVFNEDYGWELSLLYTNDDGTYAIIDHPFLVDGLETATAENGAIQLAPAEATSVAVGTNLPAGRYSFVIEAVPTADASSRLGDAFITTFEIAGEDFDGTPPTTAPIEPENPTTTTPSSDGGSNGGGSDDGASDGSGTTPTTAAPTTGAPGQPSTTEAPSSGGDTNDGGTDDGGTSDGGTNDGAGDPTPTTAPSAGGTGTTPTTATGSSGEDSGNTGSGDTGSSSSTTAPSTTAPGAPSTTAPGDSGTTPTTQPSTSPSTTAPAGSGGGEADPSDPVTTTPTPNEPAPTPDGLGSGVAKKGAWESTSVSPQAGYVDAASTVIIRGNFPSASYVWFGDQPGQVVHQNRESMTVRTPLRAVPGIVDITIQKSRNGVVLTIPDAFAFVAIPSGDGNTGDGGADGGSTDGTTGGGTDGGSSDGGSTDGGNANGGNTDGGSSDGGNAGDGTTDGGSGDGNGGDSDGGSTDGGGSDDGSNGGDTDGTDGNGSSDSEPSQRRARMIVGAGIELDNGLRGASVTPNLAADTPVCSNDPCVAVRR